MASPDVVNLMHLAGFAVGVALYGMLLMMCLQRIESTRGKAAYALPLGVALLGLCWNGIAFVAYALQDVGASSPGPWPMAIAFSALGYLPGAVVQSAARPHTRARGARTVTAIAYGISTFAAVLQLIAAARGEAQSSAGLLVLTIGYASVLVLLLLRARASAAPSWNMMGIVALAVFSVSALHLSQREPAHAAWWSELLGHHASLALVIAILLHDYRFAFADIFLRRALALVAVVTLALTLHLTVGAQSRPGDESLTTTLRHVALLVTTALLYPRLRRVTDYVVDRLILGRADFAQLRAQLAEELATSTTEVASLNASSTVLARALGGATVGWTALERDDARDGTTTLSLGTSSTRVRTADGRDYVFDVAKLSGGRRLLSDDLTLLDWVVISTARRVDAIRLARERVAHVDREREILQLATEAELRALRAQLNPHFLFNALNTIGALIERTPDRALATLYRLTSMLRTVLRGTSNASTTLGDELQLVEAYLAIERERFEERLTVRIDVADELRLLPVPALVLQPLVENAIKHGIAPHLRGGSVMITARWATARADALGRLPGTALLELEVRNTGALLRTDWPQRRLTDAVGIRNIEQRLARHFGGSASVHLGRGADGDTVATIVLPVDVNWSGATVSAA